MKFLTILIFYLFFAISFLFAQNKDSTNATKNEQNKQRSEQQKDQIQKQDEKENGMTEGKKENTPGSTGKKLEGFVDVNANGIDDRLETSGKGEGKGQPRDRFIDEDGDGICDGKESAIGLRKLFRKRRGKHNRQ